MLLVLTLFKIFVFCSSWLFFLTLILILGKIWVIWITEVWSTSSNFSPEASASVFTQVLALKMDFINGQQSSKGRKVTSVLSSLVAQRVKKLPLMRETWVRSLGREDPLEKEMATHPSILAWRIPWMEEPGRLQCTGSQRVEHDWATSLSLYFIEKSSKPHSWMCGLEGSRNITAACFLKISSPAVK